MLSILKVYDVDFEDVKKIAQQKRSEKGGFDNRIYNDFVEIEASNPSIEYYRSQPDQYPEIK